jgi:nitrogen fixation protein FixH
VHTETIREVVKAEAPSLLDRARGIVAPTPSTAAVTPVGDVRLVLMDQHERNVKHTEVVGANFRRPTLIRHGMKFAAARQAANGDWIYRQLPRERA